MVGLRVFACCLCTLLICSTGYSQVCTGSLGDPVVNITFGSGNGIGPPLSSTNTNYNYVPSACPSNGNYSLVNNVQGCYSTWHNLPQDHTPDDVNGYMMLVNASVTPGVFYKETVSGLCPNTTYEFAAWIINLIKSTSPDKPNITFTIETSSGQQLAPPYNTGNIPEISAATWQKYGFLFSTPVGTSEVVIVMRNNTFGGNGNDLAIDDITFRPCGPTISSTATVVGSPQNNLCEGKPGMIELDATVSAGYTVPTYQWQVKNSLGWTDLPGATTQKYLASIASASIEGYQYRLAVADAVNGSNVSCRIYSPIATIAASAAITADAGPDKTTFQNQGVKLEGKPTGSNQLYNWSPDLYLNDPTSLTPIASPPEDITYTLHVTSTDGCASTAKDQMTVHVLTKMVVLNTFTPNGDGVNDNWNIIGLSSYQQSTTTVYNRYGEAIFSSTGYPQPWDGTSWGKPVPVGTYTYLIDLKDGSPKLSGWLLVVR